MARFVSTILLSLTNDVRVTSFNNDFVLGIVFV